ncbi:MAG: NUDIX domain-containing protein [Candidatus Thorarchaeota archaeon]
MTRGAQLLVFVEQGFEYFGWQIPAGSQEEGESLENAILRETGEETGLKDIHINRHLGSTLVDQRKHGLEIIHHRHFYHVLCNETTPDTWSHEEKDPSFIAELTPERIIFNLFWVDLKNNSIQLAEGHGAFIPELLQELKIE